MSERKNKTEGYDVFEYIRPEKNGGSLLTAINSSLLPVFVTEGEDSQEILVLEATIGHFQCRFINAYRPQEYVIYISQCLF